MRSKRAILQATSIIITTTHTTRHHQLFHCGRTTTTTSRITTTADAAAAETDANAQREQKRSQSLVCSHSVLVVIVLCWPYDSFDDYKSKMREREYVCVCVQQAMQAQNWITHCGSVGKIAFIPSNKAFLKFDHRPAWFMDFYNIFFGIQIFVLVFY